MDEHQFEAIIADIVLPDRTGYALIGEARRRGWIFEIDRFAFGMLGDNVEGKARF